MGSLQLPLLKGTILATFRHCGYKPCFRRSLYNVSSSGLTVLNEFIDHLLCRHRCYNKTDKLKHKHSEQTQEFSLVSSLFFFVSSVSVIDKLFFS